MTSLNNGIRILELVTYERPVLRVGEVSELLDLPKATVSRTLKTLADANLLERQAGAAGYGIGSRAVEMAQHYYSRHSCLDKIDTGIKSLVQKYGFTGHAGKIAGGERVLLLAHQGWYPLQHSARIAERKFAFDSIIGQAILARQDDSAVFSMLGLLEGQAIHGHNMKSVSAILDEVRREGVATSTDLITEGISSVGTAVADRGSGEVIGFCISFPTHAVNEAKLTALTSDIYALGRQIGQEMRDPFWEARKADRQM